MREEGAGPAFMLLLECPQGERASARDNIWRELLLHAKAWQVMRWGVVSFPELDLLISSCLDMVLGPDGTFKVRE